MTMLIKRIICSATAAEVAAYSNDDDDNDDDDGIHILNTQSI